MIGVIADDLTGAAELGAVGVRHGLRSGVALRGKPTADLDLACVDTDSRACAPEEAASRTAAAAQMLADAGADWIYKKVDSVLRGNVMAELRGAMKELGKDLALLSPANPSHERFIRDGTYFVRGKPIHETEFARDPENPRTSSCVTDLLQVPGMPTAHVRHYEQPLPASGIVVGEAMSEADLERWASRRTSRMLMAGGADFFEALLRAEGLSVTSSLCSADSAARGSSRGKLFVCGTTSEASRKFIGSAKRQGVPVIRVSRTAGDERDPESDGLKGITRQAVTALASQRAVILTIDAEQVQEPARCRRLTHLLTRVAGEVIRGSIGVCVYAEGGATAVELAHQMQWCEFAVINEIQPGVVTLVAMTDDSTRFTVKPGSYAWPDDVLEVG